MTEREPVFQSRDVVDALADRLPPLFRKMFVRVLGPRVRTNYERVMEAARKMEAEDQEEAASDRIAEKVGQRLYMTEAAIADMMAELIPGSRPAAENPKERPGADSAPSHQRRPRNPANDFFAEVERAEAKKEAAVRGAEETSGLLLRSKELGDDSRSKLLIRAVNKYGLEYDQARKALIGDTLIDLRKNPSFNTKEGVIRSDAIRRECGHLFLSLRMLLDEISNLPGGNDACSVTNIPREFSGEYDFLSASLIRFPDTLGDSYYTMLERAQTQEDVAEFYKNFFEILVNFAKYLELRRRGTSSAA